MLHYARSDTHYLLDIYDHLRLALHEKEASSTSNPNTMDVDSSAADVETETPLLDVFNRSISTSSSVFSLAPYDSKTGHQENGWLGLLGKHQQLKAYATALAVPTLPIKTGWGPGELKFEVLRAVHEWREKVAREEDESTRWVMGNEQVWMVAERRPRDAVEVMKCVGMARGGVSEVVRRRKEEVAALVREVVERIGEMVAEESEVVMGRVEEGARGEAALQPAVRPVGGLWEEEESAPIASSSKIVATSSSTFFGSTKTAPALSVAEGLVATTSGFFGSAKKSAVAKGKGKQVQKVSAEERAEAVRKVHASLVLGGGLANVS
jgi:exosome complex exonuclease RRP6